MKRLAIVLVSLLVMAGCEVHVVEVDTVPPAPPVGLYTETGDGFIEIFWLANGEWDIAGYNIYAGPAYEGPYELIGTSNVPYFNDVAARNGMLYYYAVTAFDVRGNESALSLDVAYDIARPEGYNVGLSNYWVSQRSCGYDFSSYAVVSYVDDYLDMFFEIYDGVPYMVVPTDTDILDMGPTGSLLEVREAPADGWSATGDVVLRVGHTYVVRTWDDHYAKFRVTSLTGRDVTFDWAYQLVEGSPLLKKAPAAERQKIQHRDRGH